MNRRAQLFGKTLFVDLMMSTLVVVTALLIASNAVEKEKQRRALEEASIRTDGFYAIVMEWPDSSQDDVDLYVRDPSGNIAYFSSRDVGLMHLEHDDQGTVSDTAETQDGRIAVERNEERVILRGTMTGEYTVNVHLYNRRGRSPTPVTVRLIRLRGEDDEVVNKSVTLSVSGDERTAFRFTLNAAGAVSGTNELQRRMTGGGAP